MLTRIIDGVIVSVMLTFLQMVGVTMTGVA